MSVEDKDGVIVLGNDIVNPQNNITIKTPAVADGSLEIYKGVPGALGDKLFEVDETGADFANLFGVGQTWQDVKTTKVFGLWYTNTTQAPIAVNAGVLTTTGGTAITAIIELQDDPVITLLGTTQNNTGYASAVFGIVLPGQTYRLNQFESGSVTVGYWLELRL
jgi:hypothetical protein